jgi:glutamyl-tRNA synthetase
MLDFGDFYFHEVDPSEDLKKQFYTDELAPVFTALIACFEQIDLADRAKLEEAVKLILEEYNIKFKTIAQPMRVALTGKTVSPGIFEIIMTLGKPRVLSRLNKALNCMHS